ncbi:MAG: alpha amylase C-terminal domain-containing protein, partial [Oscillospiraceae bacterium]
EKASFHGQDFAQFREWDYQSQLEWFLPEKYENHAIFQKFVMDLNKFYLKNSPLWENDDSWKGFSWISNDDYKQSVIAFRRIDDSRDELITVCNFVPVVRNDYKIGVPEKGTYYEVFNSSSEKYGGDEISNKSVKSIRFPIHGFENAISLNIPPLSVIFLKKRKTLKTAADISRQKNKPSVQQ